MQEQNPYSYSLHARRVYCITVLEGPKLLCFQESRILLSRIQESRILLSRIDFLTVKKGTILPNWEIFPEFGKEASTFPNPGK